VSQASEYPWPPRYFEHDDATLVPTSLLCSPWDARAIAGGPVSSLLASCIEDEKLDSNFQIARFQADIFGNGFGNATDASEWSFANLDITVQFLRSPLATGF